MKTYNQNQVIWLLEKLAKDIDNCISKAPEMFTTVSKALPSWIQWNIKTPSYPQTEEKPLFDNKYLLENLFEDDSEHFSDNCSH